MNFLAHFQLAWPDEGLVLGALEGDYYKGPLGSELPDSLARGVRLHRAIDAYTDNHPTVVSLRRHFPAGLRRYAGILIDLSFDHYLTQHWHSFNVEKLTDFNRKILRTLNGGSHTLSSGSKHMLARMDEFDILNCYHEWQAVTGSAERIGQRFRRGNPLVAIEQDMEPLRDAMEGAFLEFYPQLQGFVIEWRGNGTISKP
jgi:acyl carrier protein phosphodiesterase